MMPFRTALLLGLLLSFTSSLAAANKAVERMNEAADVLDEIMAGGDRAIPSDLLNKAHCVVIVPGLKKGGFIFSAKYGKGVFCCRGPEGKGWTGPAAIRIEGGGFGLQIGGSSSDVIMLVMNEKGKDNLVSSKFTIGGDATAAAGPVGRSAQAQTDAQMRAEILSYSRSRGIFAGISLEGATLRPANDDNRSVYVSEFAVSDVVN